MPSPAAPAVSMGCWTPPAGSSPAQGRLGRSNGSRQRWRTCRWRPDAGVRVPFIPIRLAMWPAQIYFPIGRPMKLFASISSFFSGLFSPRKPVGLGPVSSAHHYDEAKWQSDVDDEGFLRDP